MAKPYISEITGFLQSMKEAKPAIEAEQKKARAIWWDKAPQSPEEMAATKAARVPQRAYQYYQFGNPSPGKASPGG